MGQQLQTDIFSFTVFGQTMVVLNSAAAANDLLEKRSSIYSDRPKMTVITDEWLLDARKGLSVCPSGPRFRAYRRMMQKFVTRTAATRYHAYQEAETKAFMKRLLDSTDDLEQSFTQATAGIIMRITYGYEVKSPDDRFVTLASIVNEGVLRAALPLNFLVDVVPILKYIPAWMPAAGWKRDILNLKSQKDKLVDETFSWTKASLQAGTAQASMVRTLLEDMPQMGMPEEEAEDHIKHLAGTMFAADTYKSVTTLRIFVLAMALYPEVQADAQAEIDRVVGQNRLPNFEDQDSLPTVNAIIQEVNRWIPAAPLFQDDVYRGYLIPKGAVLRIYYRAITRDPAIYPEPETFNPKRFLEGNAPLAPAFGWGRRICPGRYIAESGLFIAFASMLAAFTISKARDEHGNEIIPEVGVKEKSLRYHLAPFKCDIKPRSERHRALVADA
ncbi:cytochrome P450 family protein [Ceratobasidium sp. AG-Ba]|nr:cytochrome P450 family protein [Ceratobasidium sp. AG-Ba]